MQAEANNRCTWTWNKSRGLACTLVADDEYSDKEIARRVGCSKRTLERWKAVPEFMARVLEVRMQLRAKQLRAALKYGVASADERMRVLNEVWERAERLIRERAKDLGNVPGGRTGLLSKRIKTIRVTKPVTVTKKVRGKVVKEVVHVDVNRVVEEFRADCALVGKIVAVAEQAAKQMGEWVERYRDESKEYDGELAGWNHEELAAARAVHKMRQERLAREAAEREKTDADGPG